MNNIVSSNARTLLARSLRPVESSKAEIRDALAESLARSALSDTPETIASLLLSFLIEQVRHVVETGEPGNLELYRAEQRLHGVAGRHYSRFGDALVPVLRDTLGATYPRPTASAWGDAFWALVRRMQQAAPTPEAGATAPLIAVLID